MCVHMSAVLGSELRDLCMLGKYCIPEFYFQPKKTPNWTTWTAVGLSKIPKFFGGCLIESNSDICWYCGIFDSVFIFFSLPFFYS